MKCTYPQTILLVWAQLGPKGYMGIRAVLSVVLKIPKCTSHIGIGLGRLGDDHPNPGRLQSPVSQINAFTVIPAEAGIQIVPQVCQYAYRKISWIPAKAGMRDCGRDFTLEKDFAIVLHPNRLGMITLS